MTFRVTQNMLSQRSLDSLQLGLGRLAKAQEHLSTGRILNRPSDSPSDTTSAMRIRTSLAQADQHVRNGDDAVGRLGMLDGTLQGMANQVRKARELGLAGANSGAMSTPARAALAAEVDQLRESLLADSNAKYLERPIFGGITAGSDAYDPAGAYVGTPGAINRTVGTGVTVRVDVTGTDVFGPDGDSVFDELTALADALRAGDDAATRAGIDKLQVHMEKIGSVQAMVGARQAQVERSLDAAEDVKFDLTARLSELENVDVAQASVDLALQEMAYQAALAATGRVLQPSLLDFLR